MEKPTIGLRFFGKSAIFAMEILFIKTHPNVMKAKFLFVLWSISLFLGCQLKKDNQSDSGLLLQKYKEIVHTSIYNYNMRHYLFAIPDSMNEGQRILDSTQCTIAEIEGQKMLDTALCVINQALIDFPNNPYFIEQKMNVLTERKDYDAAIQAANENNWNIINDSLYPHKKLVQNRLKAMKSFSLNNKEEFNSYIQTNLQLLQDYLRKREKEVSEHIKSQDFQTACKEGYFLAFIQYYKHCAWVYGEEEALKQLNQITDINPDLLILTEVFITEDFLKYTMG